MRFNPRKSPGVFFLFQFRFVSLTSSIIEGGSNNGTKTI